MKMIEIRNSFRFEAVPDFSIGAIRDRSIRRRSDAPVRCGG